MVRRKIKIKEKEWKKNRRKKGEVSRKWWVSGLVDENRLKHSLILVP